MKEKLKVKLSKRTDLAILKDADSLMKLSTSLAIAVVTGIIISPLVLLFGDSLQGETIEPKKFLDFVKSAGFWFFLTLELTAMWIIVSSKQQALAMYDLVEIRKEKIPKHIPFIKRRPNNKVVT